MKLLIYHLYYRDYIDLLTNLNTAYIKWQFNIRFTLNCNKFEYYEIKVLCINYSYANSSTLGIIDSTLRKFNRYAFQAHVLALSLLISLTFCVALNMNLSSGLDCHHTKKKTYLFRTNIMQFATIAILVVVAK